MPPDRSEMAERRRARRRPRRAGLAIVALLALLGISWMAVHGRGEGPAQPAATWTPGSPAVTRSPVSWPTYHGDLARSGADTSALAARTPVRASQTKVDGDVYGAPVSDARHAYITTENDSVYSLDAATGKVVWQTSVGTPDDDTPDGCDGPDQVGITSTPVLDPASSTLYVVAMTRPGEHDLVALDTASGHIRWRRQVDPPNTDPLAHGQRPALALANGYVYVALGGHNGDCGRYVGWIVAAKSDNSADPVVFRAPDAVQGDSFWAPSGPAIDTDGSVYMTDGNGVSGTPGWPTGFANQDAVFRLSPDLNVVDWWAAPDWQARDLVDADVGSVGPALIDGGLIAQGSKGGVLYVIPRSHMGNIGGEVAHASVCTGGVSDTSFGGTAYLRPLLYVPCQESGISAVRIDGSSISVAWHQGTFWAGPPIISGGILWTVDIVSGDLHGFRADTGAPFAVVPTSKVAHFTTPGLAGGRLIVGGLGYVTAVSY